ncbi:PTS transporter subunit EIIC [Bacillus swezeyi]|uniref:Permease IIC component n=1 Tax=Bacillus swezeyi TaxID=1925020 RepID=A0A1R1QR68_9BACI|nr:PTS transporter subunit EIIC [Bacillus swezeyi]MEC1259045.1 PTS transporter subunit EIIC [Bacillus swezeyi]MED1737980.1 PTS transporter subunit EIIC [Bacillus swezeyi]MED2927994.1 PTS transporter subunit EIIC [Bacillus swezeyi]MED2942254.1 PTS transporter subunit EIIC [Bacillus swezeyi]MED2965094.1 PTS transporter subunit EIIC [Bacillus swezeyi]
MSKIAKVTQILEQAAFKITSFKYIKAIKSAFVTLMPVIIVGAFAVLMQNMVMSPETGLAVFPAFRFLAALEPVMASINYATLNFITIGAVFFIGIELGKLNGLKSFFPGLMALMSYISVIPSTVMLEVNGSMQEVVNVLAKEFTDPKSLFLGMFISIASVEIFSKLVNMDKLNIKMPDSVPANVSLSFASLIPSIITITFIASCGFAFYQLTGVYLHEAVYNVVQKPLEGVIQGLPGILTLMFVAQFFWVIGIHGNQMVKPVREPLLLASITVNMNAYAAGETIPNIITMPFWDVYMSIGGSGVTLGLLIAIFIAGKREDMRSITKLSFGPGIFNINEPVIFGLPVMLNPLMAIPFVITPLVTGTIGYFATAAGFAGKAVVMVPWTTPPLINAWLSTGGSLGAVLTQIVCIIASVFIYLPFVILMNRNYDVSTEQNMTV